MNYMAADTLARKIPFVIGAIVVLLIVNTALQYAAGPALHHALPVQQDRTVHVNGDRTHLHQDGSDHHLATDVAPGGADAELLCVDKKPSCDKQLCSKVSVKYQECKSTCNACDQLRSSIQTDTGLQLRVVQQLSACVDLHPTCDKWVEESKCIQEPKSMLELCQASCGFCHPPAVSSLALSGSSSGQQSGSSDADSLLLDECQDDINVCPYLASTGMCKAGSMWIATQCPRSCGNCAARGSTQADDDGAGLTQQIIDGDDSAAVLADGSKKGGPGKAVVLGKHTQSEYSLYGSHTAGSTTFTAEPLQEWEVPDCKDHVDRCKAWAADGECKKNVDYMLISCKASCSNCKLYSTTKPFKMVQLNSGHAMPTVGFGTAGLGVGTAAAVQYALAKGYRMIDTAESPDWYSEDQVGAGIAAARLPRDQLFLVSKVHPRDFGRNGTLAACKRSINKLAAGYLDLLLLHYPFCTPGTNCITTPHMRWQDSWMALEELVAAKLTRSIGVSNFGLSEMQELLKLAKVKPAVLETRSDPFAINHHLINFCIEHNITFIGYSNLGTQWINSPAAVNPVITSNVLKQIAGHHPGKSVPQVVLRWALQRGQVVIPRSSSKEHIAENLQLFDFELSDLEMQEINSFDGTWKTGGLPLPVA